MLLYMAYTFVYMGNMKVFAKETIRISKVI